MSRHYDDDFEAEYESHNKDLAQNHSIANQKQSLKSKGINQTSSRRVGSMAASNQ